MKKKIGFAAFLMLLFIGFMLKPKIVVRSQTEVAEVKQPPSSTSAGRGIASVGVANVYDDTLIKMTRLLCEEKYNRDACLVHLSKCGEACTVNMTDKTKNRIWTDYVKLQTESKNKTR